MANISTNWTLLTSLGNTGINIDIFCHENMFTLLDTKYNNVDDIDDLESLIDSKVSELENEAQFNESVTEEGINGEPAMNISFANIETNLILQSGDNVQLLFKYKKWENEDID